MKVYNKTNVLTCSKMREVDALAISMGIPGIVLMENAAGAVTQKVLEYEPERVLILCGKGQNGGDGFAVARQLVCKGVYVCVAMVCEREDVSGDARINLEAFCGMGGEIIDFSDLTEENWDVIVDALLGTGIKGEVKGKYVDAIDFINKSNAAVISVDIPSGINGDNGEVCGCAVKADRTVTFACYKQGLLSDLSVDYTGEISVADISIPPAVDEKIKADTFVITDVIAKGAFPKKSRGAHKGNMGRLYIAGGSYGMAGAVCMAADAAERSGAGLITCAVPENIMPVVMSKITGAMCTCIDNVPDFSVADSLLIGNGMGNTGFTRKYVLKALSECGKTLVIDADGLNVIKDVCELKNTRASVIITPHIGEMSRLTKISTEEILKNKLEIARDFAVQSGATVVLKGARTVVACPDGTAYINNRGTPAMAKGGSGDILAGLIAGIAAKGTPAYMAACAGVYVHAVAGELAEQLSGEYSVVPEELISCIGKAILNL